MFEARLLSSSLLKQIVDALKDLVTEATIQCTKAGLEMQAMDSAHISLCTLQLKSSAFETFRCDRDISMGISLTNLAKILKCAGNDDSLTMRAADDADVCTFIFENTKMDKISEFEFKLMDIDSEHLQVPETKYDCLVKMSSKEFRTIISDLMQLGDSCTIGVSKEGVVFSVSGDMATANVTVRQSSAVDTTDDKNKAVPCTIDMKNPVTLGFNMRYLANFTKATPLADSVRLSMSSENPLVVEYVMTSAGDIKYYLAPKLDEEGGGAGATAAQ